MATISIGIGWSKSSTNVESDSIRTLVYEAGQNVAPVPNIILEDLTYSFRLQKSTTDSAEMCSACIRIPAHQECHALCLIATVEKLEVFTGVAKEYEATVHGDEIDDNNDEPDEMPAFYRFNIAIGKPAVDEVELKFVTQQSEIFIAGILAHVFEKRKKAPDPVSQLLATSDIFNNFLAIADSMKRPHKIKSTEAAAEPQPALTALESRLKAHVDLRFEELKEIIDRKLNTMEMQQQELLSGLDAMKAQQQQLLFLMNKFVGLTASERGNSITD